MPDQAPRRPEGRIRRIPDITFGDTMIFDPVLPGEETVLEACGKCGVCAVCGECGKSADDLRRDIEILRRRIEVNPEILRDIKKRWDIVTPHQ